MQIIQQPDSFCFTSNLPDIIVYTGSDPLTFSIRMGSTEVLPEEKYYPDLSGNVCIRGLGTVLNAWLQTVGVQGYLLNQHTTINNFSFIYNGTARTHRIMRCEVSFDMVSAVFCKSHFLTLIFSTKRTAKNRREILAWYDESGSAKVPEISLRYLVNGQIVTEKLTRTTIGTGLIRYVDVSPKWFIQPGKVLIDYIVSLELRTMRYRMVEESQLQETHFVYRNCFGIEETFTCIGEATSKAQYERHYAWIGGKYRNFLRKNLREYTVNTGVLTQAEAYSLDDMFATDEIWLYDETGLIGEVVILDEKAERSSLPDELPSFEFSYRFVRANQRYKTVEEPRIFDATFDKTFN